MDAFSWYFTAQPWLNCQRNLFQTNKRKHETSTQALTKTITSPTEVINPVYNSFSDYQKFVRKKHCFQGFCREISLRHIMKTCPCNEHPLYTPLLYSKNWGLHGYTFLAHLSRRLIGELIVYPCSGVRPSSVGVHNFKHLLLQYRLANQSQILCGASLGRRNESLFATSESHDQDGRHAHIW